MTDITTKLRSGEHGWLYELSEQAADEIDRLRAEIARLREALSLALDEIRECDDTDGVRAKVIDVLAAMAEVEAK